ncbi:AI-2E family transporter [Candidatus Saccharibacteria bacterium]|nr:AI-2E family transporter [Candidatus Saccharibacteria bacterium]
MSKMYKVTVDTKTFIRFWLVILGFAAAGFLLFKAATGLLIIGAALFIALAINPLVRKLAKVIPGKGVKLPIAIAYLIVIGCLTAFLAIVIPTIVNETVNFAKNLPETVKTVSNSFSWLNDFGEFIGVKDLQGEIVNNVQNVSAGIARDLSANFATSIGAIGSFLAAFILILILALFMLTEGPAIVEQFWNNFKGDPQSERAHHVFDRMADVVSKYVSNALTVALINACCTATMVFVLALFFRLDPGLALPFGLITGVFSLIPMFGSFIGGALVALLLAFNIWGAGLAFIIYTIIYLQIEANLISPKIQGKGLQLPALAVLAAVTVGVYMFGIPGAIISIPVAGCIKVLIEEYGKSLVPPESEEDKKPEKKTDEKKLIAEKA